MDPVETLSANWQHLNDEIRQEVYQRLLPGYVRNFFERATSLLELRIDGNLDSTFRLIPEKPRALDPLLSAIETYPERRSRTHDGS